MSVRGSETMKHVRLKENDWSFDTGDMPEWYHEKEPLVSIDDYARDVDIILPIRPLREFLAAYDEAQQEFLEKSS